MEGLGIFGIIGVIVTIISMIACPIIAHGKGRSAFGWFFGGLILGGIVACLSDKTKAQQ